MNERQRIADFNRRRHILGNAMAEIVAPYKYKLRCDECGARAESVHWNGSDRTEVAFACADHDPGGYWMYLRIIDIKGNGVWHIADSKILAPLMLGYLLMAIERQLKR